jgi:peptide/nickel transport system substrate-binding protein
MHLRRGVARGGSDAAPFALPRRGWTSPGPAAENRLVRHDERHDAQSTYRTTRCAKHVRERRHEMKETLTRRHFLGITGAAAMSTLPGCGKSGSGTEPASTAKPASTAQSAPPPAASAGAPATTLTIAQVTDPTPHVIMQLNATNYSWKRQVFDFLTSLDASGTPHPMIAKSWTVSDDLRTYKIALRDDVVFHSGRPMTADDVAFSLRFARSDEAASQMKRVAALIDDISASGSELTLRLSAPTNQVFALFEITPIIDKESSADLLAGKKVNGTGPFMWESWDPGASFKLKRNPKYWDHSKESPEHVDVLVLGKAEALIAAARSKRSQITMGLSPLNAATLGGTAGLRVEAKGDLEAYVLGMDCSKHPFDKVEARQAIAFSIDRKRILSQVFKGYGTATSLWWPSSTPGWSPEVSDHYAYDPAVAKQKVKAAGLAGLEVPITVNGGDLVNQAILQIVLYDLQQAGLRPKANVIEATDFNVRNPKGTLGEMFLHKTGFGAFSSPSICAASTAHLKPNGGTHFDTPQYEKLIEAAVTADASGIAAANAALGKYLVEQAPEIVTVLSQSPIVVDDSVKGLTEDILGHLVLSGVSV